MKVESVDRLNIGLMLLSGAAALTLPFELFLLVYAVLGPLHYLTEISWLHDRGYYCARGRTDALPLLVLGGLYTAVGLRWWAPSPRAPEWLMLASLGAAAVLAFAASSRERAVAALVTAAAVVGLASTPISEPLTVLLPTLLHVSAFTGLFVLAGALKNGKPAGYASFAVFVAVSAGLLAWRSSTAAPQPAPFVLSNYGFLRDDGLWHGDFIGLNFFVARLVGTLTIGPGTTPGEVNAALYLAPAGRALMSFIAFSYTYHYLNWFSKTSVIRWHEVPPRRLAAVLGLWAASLGVYAWDYAAGLKWLFFLSFTHVLLELPLDLRTLAEVSRRLSRLPAPDTTGSRASRS